MDAFLRIATALAIVATVNATADRTQAQTLAKTVRVDVETTLFGWSIAEPRDDDSTHSWYGSPGYFAGRVGYSVLEQLWLGGGVGFVYQGSKNDYGKYRSFGFRITRLGPHPVYERSNIEMGLEL